MDANFAYCRDCGKQISRHANACPNCGCQCRSPKSAGVAAIFSFIIPGAGQVYAGRPSAGMFYFFGCVAVTLFGAIVSYFLFTLGLFVSMLSGIVWIASIYDAYVNTNEV